MCYWRSDKQGGNKETPFCSLVMCHHRLESFCTAWSALRLQELCILHPHLCLVSKSSSLATPLASQWTGLRRLQLFLGHSPSVCWHWWHLNCPLLLFSRQGAEPGKEGWQSHKAFPKNTKTRSGGCPPMPLRITKFVPGTSAFISSAQSYTTAKTRTLNSVLSHIADSQLHSAQSLKGKPFTWHSRYSQWGQSALSRTKLSFPMNCGCQAVL